MAEPKSREDAARSLKAAILAAFLQQYGFTLELARLLDDDGWRKVANCARINPPSETTQRAAIDELKRRELEDFRKRLARLERKTRPTKKTTREYDWAYRPSVAKPQPTV